MPFEARSLRVQLPCGPVTLIEADRHAAAKVTGWGNIVFPGADDDCSDCGTGSFCPHGSDGPELIDRICHGTDPLDQRIVVDSQILPILREQLQARLEELDVALEAVARSTGGSQQP